MLDASIYGAFFSPLIYRPNMGVTYNEVQGMKFLFDKKGKDHIISILDRQVAWRFCDLFFGWYKRHQRDDVIISALPDHFGYNESPRFTYRDYYIILMEWQEQLYGNVLTFKKDKEKFTKFTKEDFRKFRNDPNVNEIYEGLNIEIYKS